MRNVILYTAVSIDGFIARENGDVDWLPSSDNINNDDHEYASFYQSIDTTLMGRKTYQQILSFDCDFPYPDKINYVFTHEPQESNQFVHFVNDDVNGFVNRLKEQAGQDIWLIGGRQLNATLLNAHLIDELILTIIPIILGKGIHLFGVEAIEQHFEYVNTKTLPNGYVQIRYTKQSNTLT